MVYDTLVNAEYDPQLYTTDATMTPLPGWNALRDEHLDQYRALGVVSLAGAYDQKEIDGVVDAMQTLVASESLPPEVQLQFESEARGKVESATAEERLDYVRKFMVFYHLDSRIKEMAYKPELMRFVQKLLGAEAEVYQDMALLKPPGIGREKPWHQDHAYFNLPLGTPVVGVWIALDEATLENGCMVFLPGAQHEGPMAHFNRRDWQICDSEVLHREGKVAAPLPAGGCLIFDGLTPHGTGTNRSNKRRRALQFHYIPKGTVRTTTEERMALFGEEGRNVTC
jgi:phytanoyl-CoA hydroxylase